MAMKWVDQTPQPAATPVSAIHAQREALGALRLRMWKPNAAPHPSAQVSATSTTSRRSGSTEMQVRSESIGRPRKVGRQSTEPALRLAGRVRAEDARQTYTI